MQLIMQIIAIIDHPSSITNFCTPTMMDKLLMGSLFLFQGQWSHLPIALQVVEQLQSTTVVSALGGRLPQHMATQQVK